MIFIMLWKNYQIKLKKFTAAFEKIQVFLKLHLFYQKEQK